MTELTQRKVYKWQERPESCPECDSTCFISSGGHNLTCYHCFLSEGWDKAQATVTSLESENAELRKLLRNLLAADGHSLTPQCSFTGCNCGGVEKYKVARSEAVGAIRGGTNGQKA